MNTPPINTDKKRGEYAEELKKRGEELNLDIYTVDYKPMSHDSATYTVYSINKEVESLIKDKFKVKKNTEFNSIFSGKRKIIFKDIHEIKNNARITQYQVIGEKNNIDKFRMLTIDKYGTGKAYDGSYGGDHFFILMSVWSLALVVIVFITLIESSALKKEVSIKYINGHSKSKIIVGIIAKNACILTVAAVSAAVISNLFTAATAFGIYLICAVFGIVIVSSTIIYFQLRLKDIRKAFSSISNGNLQRITGIVLLSVTLVLFITSLSICMQNINNAYKTINQKELWKKYKEYESIVFFSSEESKIANSNLDRKYAADFYNKYVNKYDISMSFDVVENGGMSSFAIDCDDTIIYANLNGVKKMELPIDISMIKKDKLYLLLPYTMEEFKQSNSLNEVNFVLSELKEKQNIEPQYISMDKPYEITLLDIKRDNLSTNCVKNPIVIIDTFSDINNNFAINIATSIMKFEKKGDFENFIESVNYKEQVWYKENVYKMYKQKCNISIMVATVNIVLSIILLLLFFITLYTVLKAEFKYRADEICIRKILGDTFIKRYLLIFNFINMIVIIATIILCIIGMRIKIIEPLFVGISLGISYIVILLIFIIFINIYENHNIPKNLKGGY